MTQSKHCKQANLRLICFCQSQLRQEESLVTQKNASQPHLYYSEVLFFYISNWDFSLCLLVLG